jgi:hypothetical protein
MEKKKIYNKLKIPCELCGKEGLKSNYARHLRTHKL